MYINPLIIAARILDENYAKDPNPENWRTINGAKVHLNEGQQIDGGAGGKFTGKEFGSNFSAEEGFSGKYTAPKKFHKKAGSEESTSSIPSNVTPHKYITSILNSMNEEHLAKICLEKAKKELKAKEYNQDVVELGYNLLEGMFTSGKAVELGYEPDDYVAAESWLLDFQDYAKQHSTPLKKAASIFTEASVQAYNPKGKPYPFRKSNYTQAHQDNAVWCQSAKESHTKFDAQAKTVWANANAKEQAAIKEYTQSYHKFNEPLRGIEYGTSEYKGVGNIDFKNVGQNGYKNLKPGEVRDQIRAMTSYIERSAFDEDVWLQRGCNYKGMDKFLNLSKPLLEYSVDELRSEILGSKVTEHGFMSCGSAKNTGFSSHPIMFNIYAPAGTKMAYADNFSAFPGENEMILQRGTQFRVSKIEENPDGGFFIDLEVVGYNMQKV